MQQTKQHTASPHQVSFSGNSTRYDATQLDTLEHDNTGAPLFSHLTSVTFLDNGTVSVFHDGLLDRNVRSDLKQLSNVVAAEATLLLFGVDHTANHLLLLVVQQGRLFILPCRLKFSSTVAHKNQAVLESIADMIPYDAPAHNHDFVNRRQSHYRSHPPLLNCLDPDNNGYE